ncbi:MAG TPA: UDP-N-acetylmuramoyl-tripeptide--D-alanyl-D-alanine ligase, partial [Candidatus Limnocylindrales bacterium]
VLAPAGATIAPAGSMNNELGHPYTVLRADESTRFLVLELGARGIGHIRHLTEIAPLRIGAVLNVGSAHLGEFGSREAIAQAKGELVEALPADGVAILNADDERVRRMSSRTGAQSVTYGFAADADVRAEAVASRGADGMTFELVADGGRAAVAIPTLGRMAVHNALAAAAAGRAAGLPVEVIVDALALGWSAPHRSEVVRAGGVTIVDDSYNASPGSVAAALELIAGLPGRRVAVLGEMLELGAEHESGHRGVGEAAAAVLDRLVVVGVGAGGIAAGALAGGLDPGAVSIVTDRAQALDVLREDLDPGDVLLVKASRGVALDLLVDDLVAALGGPETTSR